MGNRSILALGLLAAAAVAAALLLPSRAQPDLLPAPVQSEETFEADAEPRAAEDAPQNPRAGGQAQKAPQPEPAPDAPAVSTPSAPKLDAYGDPLPPGAVARLGTVRYRHHTIWDFTYTPDGMHLAVVGSGGTILMNAKTGILERRVCNIDNCVERVIALPDNKRLVNQSSTDISMWNLEDGTRLWKRDMTGIVSNALALSPDGTLLAATATGKEKGTVLLLDTQSGETVRSFRLSDEMIYGMDWSPDGRTLAAGAGDCCIYLARTDTGQKAGILKGHTRTVFSVAFSPDGRRLASGFMMSEKVSPPSDAIRIWDTSTMQQVDTVPCDPSRVYEVFYPPGDCRTLVWKGGPDGTVHVWDMERHSERLALPETAQCNLVRFAPDGKTLVAGAGMLSALLLFDPATGKRLGPVGAPEIDFVKLALSPDGLRIATSDAGGGHVQLWDRASGRLLRTFGKPCGFAGAISWSPDGKRIAAGTSAALSDERPVSIWDADSGALVRTWPSLKSHAANLVFAPDGERLVWVGYTVQQKATEPNVPVRVWDIATGKDDVRIHGSLGETNLRLWPAAAIDPTGRRLAAQLQDSILRVWDLETGREIARKEEAEMWTPYLTFLPGGQTVAYLEDRNRFGLHLWDFGANATQWFLKDALRFRKRLLHAMDFPDLGWVVCLEREGRIEFWQASNAHVLFTLPATDAQDIDLSADGRWAVSWHKNATALVWDLRHFLRDAAKDERPDF